MERKASITALMSSFGRAFHAENEDHPVFADHHAKELMTAEEYSAGMQGYKQWFYRTWTNGVGNADMLWNRDGSYHWRGVHAYDAIWMYDNTLYMHPDTDQTMLEWTASSAGTIQISGSVRKYDVAGGDGVSI